MHAGKEKTIWGYLDTSRIKVTVFHKLYKQVPFLKKECLKLHDLSN